MQQPHRHRVLWARGCVDYRPRRNASLFPLHANVRSFVGWTALLWFGFNGGSALSPNEIASVAFINTDISASTAMVTWMLLSWRHRGKPSIIGALTGVDRRPDRHHPGRRLRNARLGGADRRARRRRVLRRGAVQGEDGLGRRPRCVGRARRGRHPRLDPHRHVRDPGARRRGTGVRRREPVLRQLGRHRDQRGVRNSG